MRRAAFAALLLAGIPRAGSAVCVGDCPPANDTVSIGELITGVNIALRKRDISACPAFDANDSGAVEINELIQGVRNALNGCPPPAGSPTPTPTEPPPTPTPVDTPTPTATLAGGPVVIFRGIAAPDDTIYPPTRFENQIPVYELPFGLFFRIVVEASFGQSGRAPGLDTFVQGGPPDLQVQASRPLGNGNPQVCDGALPDTGIPGFSPPRFDAAPEVVAAFNDFGCRFPDGAGLPLGRGCAEAGCVLFSDGLRGCVDSRTQVQFCSRTISIAEAFPTGDTLLSMRVLDVAGAPGPVAQMIIRVAP